MSDDGMRELRNAAARLEAQRVPVDLFDAQAMLAEEPHLSHGVVGCADRSLERR